LRACNRPWKSSFRALISQQEKNQEIKNQKEKKKKKRVNNRLELKNLH